MCYSCHFTSVLTQDSQVTYHAWLPTSPSFPNSLELSPSTENSLQCFHYILAVNKPWLSLALLLKWLFFLPCAKNRRGVLLAPHSHPLCFLSHSLSFFKMVAPSPLTIPIIIPDKRTSNNTIYPTPLTSQFPCFSSTASWPAFPWPPR